MNMERMMGALLTYPDANLLAALPQIRQETMDDRRLPKPQREALLHAMEDMAAQDVYALQEDYVACFDRGRATSLHLFEHVHGESRERGPAMIDLREQYLQAGLALKPGELPDYLPAFLEYLAHLPTPAARVQLGSIAHILHNIHHALLRQHNRYAAVLAALLALAGEKVQAAAPPLPASPASSASPSSPTASPSPALPSSTFDDLDAEWAEQPAFGSAQAGACRPGAAGAAQPLVFVPAAGRSGVHTHRRVTP